MLPWLWFVASAGDRRGRPPSEQGSGPRLRERLLGFIRLRPGARLSRISQELQANLGTAKYHLAFLERVGAVRVVRERGNTRYFPPYARREELPLFAVLLRGRVIEVAREIMASPGVGQNALVRRLGISRKVFREYADLLTERSLLIERKGNHTRHYYPTERLQDLVGKLEEPRGDAP